MFWLFRRCCLETSDRAQRHDFGNDPAFFFFIAAAAHAPIAPGTQLVYILSAVQEMKASGE